MCRADAGVPLERIVRGGWAGDSADYCRLRDLCANQPFGSDRGPGIRHFDMPTEP